MFATSLDTPLNFSTVFEQIETFLIPLIGSCDLGFVQTAASTPDIAKLVQVLVVCAIKSERKEDVINNIMIMDEAAQQHLMHTINDTLEHMTQDETAAEVSGLDDSMLMSPSRDACSRVAESPHRAPRTPQPTAAMKEEMDQLVEMVLTGHRWHDDSEMDTRCGS